MLLVGVHIVYYIKITNTSSYLRASAYYATSYSLLSLLCCYCLIIIQKLLLLLLRESQNQPLHRADQVYITFLVQSHDSHSQVSYHSY